MTVKCVNGDIVLYPLAWVTITIMDGVTVKNKAAVAGGLPVSVLLSTDIRELGQLLQANRTTMYTQAMIALSIIGESFERIAIDIICPLPHSKSEHCYYNPTSLMISIGWGGETAMWVPYISGLN